MAPLTGPGRPDALGVFLTVTFGIAIYYGVQRFSKDLEEKPKPSQPEAQSSLPLVGPETVAHKSIFKERRPAYPIPVPQAHSWMRKCSGSPLRPITPASLHYQPFLVGSQLYLAPLRDTHRLIRHIPNVILAA